MEDCYYELTSKDGSDIVFKISSSVPCCYPFDNKFSPVQYAKITVVAYSQNIQMGYISFWLNGPDKPAQLVDLFVGEQFQGKGLASKLLEIMHRFLVLGGIKQVYGYYGPKAKTAQNAYQMYTKHGYKYSVDSNLSTDDYYLKRTVVRDVDDTIRTVDEQKSFNIMRDYSYKMTEAYRAKQEEAEYNRDDWEKAYNEPYKPLGQY